MTIEDWPVTPSADRYGLQDVSERLRGRMYPGEQSQRLLEEAKIRKDSATEEHKTLEAMKNLQGRGWELEDEILESKQRIIHLEAQLEAMFRIIEQQFRVWGE